MHRVGCVSPVPALHFSILKNLCLFKINTEYFFVQDFLEKSRVFPTHMLQVQKSDNYKPSPFKKRSLELWASLVTFPGFQGFETLGRALNPYQGGQEWAVTHSWLRSRQHGGTEWEIGGERGEGRGVWQPKGVGGGHASLTLSCARSSGAWSHGCGNPAAGSPGSLPPLSHPSRTVARGLLKCA